MVSLLSFFTGKKKSRRAPSPPPSNALTHGGTQTTHNGGTSPPRKAAGRFLSMRHKPTPGRPADIASRRASSDVARKRSTKRASKEDLPKLALGWESGSAAEGTLGLEGVGRPPKLTDEERDVLDGIRWSLEEVAKGWNRIGQALMDYGLDTPGIFVARKLPTDIHAQQLVLALFALSVNPSLTSSFPSLTSHYTSSTSTDSSNNAQAWTDRLRIVLADSPQPANLTECLKYISRRQATAPTSSSLAALGVGLYTSFLRAEQLAGFPADSYDKLFVPRVTPGVKAYLDDVFRVWAAVAAHANANELTGGKLSWLLGWWIWGKREKQENWRSLYDGWVAAGRRIEHLFFAWIRCQSAKQNLPTRLLQLVEGYPYGEVQADAEFLPIPPSSFPRRTLRLVIASETPLSTDLTPRSIVHAALDTTASPETAPSWSSVQSDSTASRLETLLDDDSATFLRSFSGATAGAEDFSSSPAPSASETPTNIEEEPIYRPFSATLSAQHARRRSQSHSDIKPNLSLLSPVDTSLAATSSGNTSPGSSSPSRLAKQASADVLRPSPKTTDTWDNFMSAGFGEGAKDKLELSPMVAHAALRPSLSSRVISFGSDTTERPAEASRRDKGRYKFVEEEVIEVDDLFIPFMQDGQLDKVTSASWPPFALAHFRTPMAHADGNIECILVTLEHRPPPRSPSPISPPIERSASPTESTASRSLGFFRRSSSFGPRRSLFGSKPVPKTSASAYPLPTLTESGSSKNIKEEPTSAMSEAPTEYTITEMGEMVKIPSETSPVVASASPDISPGFDPTNDSKASEWVYRAEGRGHLIFKYKGQSPAYSKRVLRIRKPTYPLSAHQAVATHWKETLLPKLLPAELLLTSSPVKLDRSWTRELLEAADKVRPESRKLESGDLVAAVQEDVMGSIMDDTTAVEDDAETILAVEIKPKWGFLPSASNVVPPEAAEIKSKHSRYILHRHYKQEGLDDTYDPLDLFSTNQVRVQEALEGLWAIWNDTAGAKNNWRVYMNGKPIMPNQIDLLPGSPDASLIRRTAPFLLPALQASDVLSRLRDLQATLDPVDISTLAQRFRHEHPDNDLFDASVAHEPTLAELDAFVAKYRADPTGHGFWTLREQLIAYALSAIFKDCSIFVTIPLKQDGSEWNMQPGARVKIIDLDLKDVGALKKWYDLDEAIWRYWLDTHPADGASVETSAEKPECTINGFKSGFKPTLKLSHSGLSATDGSSTRAIFVPSPSPSGRVTPTQSSTRDASINLTPKTGGLSLGDALAISPARRSFVESVDGRSDVGTNGLSFEDALAMTPSTPYHPRDATDTTMRATENAHAKVPAGDEAEIADCKLGANGLPLPPTRSESPIEEREKRSLAPSPSPTPGKMALPDDQDAESPRPLEETESVPSQAEQSIEEANASRHSEPLIEALAAGAAVDVAAAGPVAGGPDDAEPLGSAQADQTAVKPQPKAIDMLRDDSGSAGTPGLGTDGTSTPFEEFSTPAADIPEPVLAAVGMASTTVDDGIAKPAEDVTEAEEVVDSETEDYAPRGSDDTFGQGQIVQEADDVHPASAVDNVLLGAPVTTAAVVQVQSAEPSLSLVQRASEDTIDDVEASAVDVPVVVPPDMSQREQSLGTFTDEADAPATRTHELESRPESPVTSSAAIDTTDRQMHGESSNTEIGEEAAGDDVRSPTALPKEPVSETYAYTLALHALESQDQLGAPPDMLSATDDGEVDDRLNGPLPPAISSNRAEDDVLAQPLAASGKNEIVDDRDGDSSAGSREDSEPSQQVVETFVPLQDVQSLGVEAPADASIFDTTAVGASGLENDVEDQHRPHANGTPTAEPRSEVSQAPTTASEDAEPETVEAESPHSTGLSLSPQDGTIRDDDGAVRNGTVDIADVVEIDAPGISGVDRQPSAVASFLETQMPGETPAVEVPPILAAPADQAAETLPDFADNAEQAEIAPRALEQDSEPSKYSQSSADTARAQVNRLADDGGHDDAQFRSGSDHVEATLPSAEASPAMDRASNREDLSEQAAAPADALHDGAQLVDRSVEVDSSAHHSDDRSTQRTSVKLSDVQASVADSLEPTALSASEGGATLEGDVLYLSQSDSPSIKSTAKADHLA